MLKLTELITIKYYNNYKNKVPKLLWRTDITEYVEKSIKDLINRASIFNSYDKTALLRYINKYLIQYEIIREGCMSSNIEILRYCYYYDLDGNFVEKYCSGWCVDYNEIERTLDNHRKYTDKFIKLDISSYFS